MALEFDDILSGPLVLEIDIAPPLLGQPVTVVVNNTALPPKPVQNGVNLWAIPHECSERRTGLSVELKVPRAVKPSEVKDSKDDRVLGVGIRAIGVHALTAI